MPKKYFLTILQVLNLAIFRPLHIYLNCAWVNILCETNSSYPLVFGRYWYVTLKMCMKKVYAEKYFLVNLQGFEFSLFISLFRICAHCYTQSRAPGCMTSCAASDGGG